MKPEYAEQAIYRVLTRGALPDQRTVVVELKEHNGPGLQPKPAAHLGRNGYLTFGRNSTLHTQKVKGKEWHVKRRAGPEICGPSGLDGSPTLSQERFQKAPRPAMTDGSVRSKIFRSSPKDQWSM